MYPENFPYEKAKIKQYTSSQRRSVLEPMKKQHENRDPVWIIHHYIVSMKENSYNRLRD